MRRRKVKSQRSLSRSARIQNQRNSFRLINTDGLRGEKIMLVDDIVTTGLTANQAAAEMISGHAKNIILAAVARTERHSEI
jgi:predicted amidophosphoribosyltransferase